MLVVETIARIRRDHLVKGVPIKKIARDLRVSKNTIRKVVRGDETSHTYERKIQPMPKLVLFRTLLDGAFPRLFRAVDAQISHIILALPDRGTAFDGAFPARLMKARGDRFARLVGM